MKALFETKNNRVAHNKEGNTATNGPGVALRFVSVDDALEVHTEVRLQILESVSNL